jgi:hypothetical protein
VILMMVVSPLVFLHQFHFHPPFLYPPAFSLMDTLPASTSPVPLPPADPAQPQAVPSPASLPLPVSRPSTPPVRQSGRAQKAPERYGNWAKSSAVISEDVDTPKAWRQLQKSPHKAKWLQAADEEFSSLLGMDTWRLVPRPSKWVFKVKHHPEVKSPACGHGLFPGSWGRLSRSLFTHSVSRNTKAHLQSYGIKIV